MANAEMMAKANEKRINALERKLDAFEKDFRKSGDMSGLIKRVNTLETSIKALAATAKSSGADDGAISREIDNLKNQIAKGDDKLRKLNSSFDPDAVKKVDNLEKRRDVLEKTMTALNGRAERNQKVAMAQVEKLNNELIKQGKKLQEALQLESRLKMLEALVRSASSK